MKKNCLLLIILLVSFTESYAQNIANARSQGIGSSVTVSGIITNGDELGPIRYIEDSSAGLAIYDPNNVVGVNRGDSITVTGSLIDYNGLLEIQPVTNLINHGSGYSITPQVITPNQLNEPTESELVKIENVEFDNAGTIFNVGTHGFTSNGQSGIIYVRAGHPLEGSLIPSAIVSLIGISSQYTFTGSGGYQLLLRDNFDIILSGGINITSPLEQSNFSNSGFDISWTTDNSGSTGLSFGLTNSLELGTIIDTNLTTNHNTLLTGLNAGSIYYIQAFSVNGNDTAFSAIQVFATVSNSSGKVMTYFNKSVDTSVATIQNAQNIGVYINDTIKAYIDKAQQTLDISIYNHSDALITNAINDAYNRGVKVRYITCSSTTSMALNNLDPNIQYIERPSGSGIMHNKFIVIDADNSDSCWVISGSTNWTSGQLFDDPNNLIFIQDQSVARTYVLEFNEMWGSDSIVPNMNNSLFGANKLNNTPHHFIVNEDLMEIYFSPSDNTTFNIIEALETADDEINFGLLVFTQNNLGSALVDLYNNGINVNGIIEQINSQGSEYQFLLDEGIDVREHDITNIFHHKYAIIDQNIPSSDPIIITGSHNWSAAAEINNDENTIIYHNANIANQYFQEFIERYNELNSTLSINESIYHEKGKLIKVVDALGRKIKVQKNKVLFYIYENGAVEKKIILN